MLAATLTMAPIYSFRLTSRNKTNSTAEAATFELVGRVAHSLAPSLLALQEHAEVLVEQDADVRHDRAPRDLPRTVRLQQQSSRQPERSGATE